MSGDDPVFVQKQKRPWMMNFSGGSVVKNPSASAGDRRDVGSISGFGKSPEGGNGNAFQYTCLYNLMDRIAWWASVHGVIRGCKESKGSMLHY